MCGMIEGLQKIGHEQAVIAGIDINDDRDCFPEEISFFPVIYNNEELPFPVVGMSDAMPYESTRYRDLDTYMVEIMKSEFKKKIDEAINVFKPHIIICNHLYLITSYVREIVKDIRVIGLCHGTCLRQLKSINFEKEYILSNIKELDLILALHNEQKEDIINLFDINHNKVVVIGSGYNDKMFYNENYKTNDRNINITFAGKICKSKGLKSLIKSIDKLEYTKDSIKLNIAGTGSDESQYKEIFNVSEDCRYEVDFLGRLSHKELANLFNKSNIFVLPSFYEGLPVVVLEALACGTDVIVSDINGVKEWMGESINNSGKISYIRLPKMKTTGVPLKSELPYFEEMLYRELDNRIRNILDNDECKSKLNMSDKTWNGLANRVNNILDKMV
ncbi:glycosyltransferase [Romboutsia weinsteinii]|uniref:Glycosyltransferase n=2 Tax=Romboutsia weinsteinii TaxID=2020949 RepID=A0A371IZ19_9FIRM|nr:glycosyltransferase [Romboutsia weinsteinii]